jgi:hypothetical protein
MACPFGHDHEGGIGGDGIDGIAVRVVEAMRERLQTDSAGLDVVVGATRQRR